MKTDVTKIIGSILLFGLFFFIGMSVQAQDQSSSDFEQFKDQFKKEYFSVGGLLQAVGDYQFERLGGSNGFSVGNARLQVYGEFDNKFGYQLQTNFVSSTALLDVNMYYNLTPNFSVKAGLFKAPFSYEYLTGAATIDFVNRSSVVNQLAPKRQVGLQMQGDMADGRFRYTAGMFNGNGFGANANDDDKFLYTARIEANSGIGGSSDSKFMMGLNASYEQSESATTGAGLLSQVEGEQLLLGADTRISYKGMMLAGEFIYSTINADAGTEYNPFGYYLTGGYFVMPKTQLLARWDYFDGDFIGNSSESVLGGINIFPSDFSEIQLNYIYPLEDGVDFSRILLNLQINF
ncbi:porin [Fodinibius sp.]|uniref:porin n=1 Tax=Fodinibius sp. TaxID=1872440 RepID=UPI002ACD43C2|nr:porin [Fodinibius sp.]MDZ7659997.1 porin [Fodinibius sp.]